jgi:hypothetical protein
LVREYRKQANSELNHMKNNVLIKKVLHLFFSVFVTGFLFFSCEKENFNTSGDVKLVFSHDSIKSDTIFTAIGSKTTILFDTIFTTIGSTTKSFKVINPTNQSILISSIKLAGGDQSPYRLNIDGEMKNAVNDLTIPARDSIYIFVEVTVDPNGVNQPMIVNDSILFTTNNRLQVVNLMAWGQDFVLIKHQHLNTTTWTNDKPYLVYDTAWVSLDQVLTIKPGTHIFLHDKAVLISEGAIIAIGTPEQPIIFKTDRLELMYNDVPAKWDRIWIYPNETQSVFENVEIRNSVIGLQTGVLGEDGYANIKLHNVKIEHISYTGIFAISSKIEATNTVVADCGYYCVALLVGGSYEFTHCTVSNYWSGYSNRKTSSLVISNQLLYSINDTVYAFTGDLIKANWNNSIIWGNLNSEIEFGQNMQSAFNYRFDHCLVKLADSIDVSNSDNFISLTKNIDPKFVNNDEYNYAPDSLSPVRDIGARIYGEQVPLDLNQVSRTSDAAPDLGAYEYIYIPKKKK